MIFRSRLIEFPNNISYGNLYSVDERGNRLVQLAEARGKIRVPKDVKLELDMGDLSDTEKWDIQYLIPADLYSLSLLSKIKFQPLFNPL